MHPLLKLYQKGEELYGTTLYNWFKPQDFDTPETFAKREVQKKQTQSNLGKTVTMADLKGKTLAHEYKI